MTPVLLGAAWAALVVLAAWRRRPAPARLAAGPRSAAGAPPGWSSGAAGFLHGAPLAAGALLRRLARRPPDRVAARRVGAAFLVAAATVPLAPVLAPAIGAVVWLAPAWRRRATGRAERAAIEHALPETVDLLRVAVGAGLTVPLAVAAVAPRVPGPLGADLRRAVEEVGLGRSLADALQAVAARRGEPVRALVRVLVASDRLGAPLSDALDRLAVDARTALRRRAEEAARKVPVKLLFPLVLCVLPAFALLTVVPLLVGALGSLRL